jgi:hypothetical protein
MKISRFIRVFLIFLVSLSLLLLSAAWVIAHFYEDEVKQLLVAELNKKLAVPIAVKNIELSLLKKFPNATLVFTEVRAESVQSTTDLPKTERFQEKLFEAQKIFLQFNILDIFRGKYTLHKLDLEGVKLRLLINKSGQDNYHFWKASKDSSASKMQIDLEDIQVSDADVVYKNDQNNQLYSLVIKESNLIGNFTESQYSLKTQGEYYFENAQIDNITYLKRKSVSMGGTLLVKENKIIELQDVELTLNELSFDLKGVFRIEENKNTEIDLQVNGKNLEIKTLLSLLPEEYKKDLSTYSSKGLFYFNSRISGQVGNGTSPNISANFGIKRGEIQEGSSKIVLEKINLDGSFSNGSKKNNSTCLLSINNFNANLGTSTLVGNFSVQNFDNPHLSLITEAKLNMEQVKHFLKLDTLEKCSGQVTLDLDFSGKTKHISNFSGNDFAKTKTQGSLLVENGSIKFLGAKQGLEKVNASLMFNNNDIVINECNGTIENSDFALKGFFRNALAAIFNENEKLFIEASLTSQFLDLNQILADDEQATKNKKEVELRFSERINFNLNVLVRQLVFKRFEAKNISGTVRLQDKKLALSPIAFQTMDGSVLANGIIDGTGAEGFKTLCEADLRNIAISKLFYQFENFGGTTLTDKNLKGTASATIQFSGDYSAALNSNTESILAQINLSIENGALLNFEPMRKLSRFISLTELNDIRFASLKNTIEIRNRKINIPSMQIFSSALNLNVSGTHTFDNTVDYHFKLLLNELLGKKARKAKAQNDEFGIVEDDGLGMKKTAIYISMIGPLDNPKISYDRSGLKLELKQKVSGETQNLKSILKSEFGWFKKDSTIKSSQTNKQNIRFETEWEENDLGSNAAAKKGKELPKVRPNEALEEKRKIKVLDNLLKKDSVKQNKKRVKKEKSDEENSDDFN